MKIGIIGCGYVGTALAKKWNSCGFDLSVTTRKQDRFSDLKDLATTVCLLQPNNTIENFQNLISERSVLVLSVAADNAAEYESTYLHAAKTLATVLANNQSVTQIIYTSSTSVYGEHQGAWVDENTPLAPLNANAKILVDTEQCLLGLRSTLRKVCIFRLGEIFGPGREIHHRLMRMPHKPFPGAGQNFTNLVHVDDIVEAIDFARRYSLDGVYNLCNDLHIPRREFYQQICRQHGIPDIIWDKNLPSLHGGNKRVSSTKIKQAGFVSPFALS